MNRARIIAAIEFLASSAIRRAVTGLVVSAIAFVTAREVNSDAVSNALFLATSIGLALLHSPKAVEE